MNRGFTKLVDLEILSPELDLNSEGKINSLKKIFEDLKKHKKFKENRILAVEDEEFCLAAMKAILFNVGMDTNY